VSYVVTPDRYRRSLEKIGVAAAGRSLDDFVPAHLAFITVGRDFETARNAWAARLTARYNQDFSRLADKYGVIGTPVQCVETLERFVEAGCRHFILNPIGDPRDDGEQIERIAADILPRLAGR
jgi:alkanesulfonate monooxygenase SsuD/methylene tetrahydromethanopterin reductase-like flavin-dependent oxidoreductase (luciferase family)